MISPGSFKVMLEDCRRRKCHCVTLSPQTERGQRHHKKKSEVHWRPRSFREDPGFQIKRSTQIDAQGIDTRHMHNRMGNFRQHGRVRASGRNGRDGRTEWDGILLANSYSLF